jgi:hypothetical protein
MMPIEIDEDDEMLGWEVVAWLRSFYIDDGVVSVRAWNHRLPDDVAAKLASET